MKKYPILILIVLIYLFSFKAFAEIEKGKWEFIKTDEYCFIQSSPIKSVIPEGKKRGEYYILVYRMNKNPELIVQITAGFNYKSADSIKVRIDEADYDFYADEDTGWAKNDKEVIYAMKKGLKLVLSGESSRGTITNDTYTLKGFTSAVNKLNEDC